MASSSTLIDRIRSEYLALPGLKLTMPQAQRLWPATDDALTVAMNVLVAEGFLRVLPSGTYIAMPRPHHSMAKADITHRPADQTIRCPHCQKLNTTLSGQTPAGTNVRCEACGRILARRSIPA